MNNCCICGTVKNCEIYLPRVLKNMDLIGSCFDNYEIYIYYDHSSDKSLKILKQYALNKKNVKIQENQRKSISIFRTFNLANARNECLAYVNSKKDFFKYFIMMDMDDVNAKKCNLNNIKKVLKEESKWDCVSFQTFPKYYDIWALSIPPFYFSYNHFPKNTRFYNLIQRYIHYKLNKIDNNDFLPVISAFNGFGIYKSNKFLNCKYDGRIRLDLFPSEWIEKQKKMLNVKKLLFKKYITVDGRFEDCEHRAFHISAIKNNNAKVRISPLIVFSS